MMPSSAPRSSAPRGAPAASLLPPELFYIYLVAPLLYSPLLIKGLFGFPLPKIARIVAAQYVPFLCIPAACHTVYRFWMPRWLAALPDPRWRPLLHAAVITVLTLSVGFPVHSLKFLISGSHSPLLPFLWTAVTISFSFMVPALLIQDLRTRRESAERLAAAEQKARLEMQLQALQARTNPHFLFNGLNTVASLIHDDPVLAERTIERLASLLRYSPRLRRYAPGAAAARGADRHRLPGGPGGALRQPAVRARRGR
jgi:two-component system sensor histidine kinase AlgZ